MKRTIDIITALCDTGTLPDVVIDYLIDHYREEMKHEFHIYFDNDYECDTPPEEIGMLLALEFMHVVKGQEFYGRWMYDAAHKAITEHEQLWRDEVLPGKIKLWRMDDEEDAHDE